ncbi:MAG TPA: peptidoglycan-binding domain-containing protein [Polyangiaceae bacterium]|nr:peptidoglycan-binding domain-containing protein [Polyangiaceae bacterium]
MASISDREAKKIVDSLVDELGLSPVESLAVRLVGKHESGYGMGWKRPGSVGSNNWGAITRPTGGPDTFEHEDSKWNPKTGKVEQYVTHFQKYATPRDGARGLALQLLFEGANPKKPRRANVAAALERRSIPDLAAAMRFNRYFLGVKPPEQAIADYAAALERMYQDIRADTGEDLFDRPLVRNASQTEHSELRPEGSESSDSSSPRASLERLCRSLPELRRGVRGDVVAILQFEIGCDPDEIFGPLTERALRAWQAERGLEPSGVVGPETWATIYGLASREQQA